MTFFLHDSLDPGDEIQQRDAGSSKSTVSAIPRDDIHILWEKLSVPAASKTVRRPRLTEVLLRSTAQFNATLVSGRAGTGKTTLAAEYAKQYKRIAWYSVESTDVDWYLFAHYFAASLLGPAKIGSIPCTSDGGDKNQVAMAKFIDWLIGEAAIERQRDQMLIVLDNLHHIFDAAWFPDFFQLLVSSLPENAHLLMLCRSKPPNPIWRMRSKQVLYVIDEKLLAFSLDETIALFKANELTKKAARKAYEDSFGRISKLAAIAESLRSS